MAQQIFKANMVICRNNRDYRIVMLDDTLVTLEVVDSKHHQVLSIDQLLSEYQLGSLSLPKTNLNLDQSWLNEQQKADLRRYNTYLNYLDKLEYPGAIRSLNMAISTCGEILNEPVNCRPSTSTLRRWYSKWLNNNRQFIYLLASRKHDPNLTLSCRIDAAMRSLVDDVIDSFYLTLNGPNAADCYRTLMQQHRRMALDCPMISKSTFYREIKKLDESVIIRRRQGSIAANKYLRTANHQYQVNGLFERCEMDAVHVGIYLVDQQGDIVGKPIIFLMIDAFSRCIMGMHISIQEGETTNAAVSALRHAILPKSNQQYSFMENPWTCHGTPMDLYVDSGAAFINESFDALLAQLKINRIAGPSRQPWKHSFIERFNRTLRDKLKGIPGYVGKLTDGFTYDHPAKHYATLTVEEFEKIVCILINDIYHQEAHAGVGNQTPIAMWNTHIRYSPAIVPANVAIFDLYLRQQKRGTLQQLKGLQYKNQFFNSMELRSLFEQLKKNSRDHGKVTFYVDELNASNIMVINPLNQSVLTVPNTNKLAWGKTFLQLKMTKKIFMPNAGELKVNDITKQALDRKKKAARDVKTSHNLADETLSMDIPLTQDVIQGMLTKREKVAHQALVLSPAKPTGSDVPESAVIPKIINYQTS